MHVALHNLSGPYRQLPSPQMSEIISRPPQQLTARLYTMITVALTVLTTNLLGNESLSPDQPMYNYRSTRTAPLIEHWPGYRAVISGFFFSGQEQC